MSKTQFDLKGFHRALNEKREEKGYSWKRISDLTGLSPSTLTRMGQGRKPDIDGLVSLASWAKLDLSNFYRAETANRSNRESLNEIRALLKADAKLKPRDVEILDALLTSAYTQMRK
jgi:transcriptional regulator with XRE-family HTH domain